MINISYNIVKKPSFTTIGLKWEGAFSEAEAGAIKSVMREMHQRMSEIDHVVQTDSLIGLSYNASPGKAYFTHYSTVEVKEIANVPPGMVRMTIPETTFVTTKHEKGKNIQASYEKIYQWIAENGYKASSGGLTHVEVYPAQPDTYTDAPEFIIMIPVEKERSDR